MQHVSESVFRELCLILGTSQQVAIRRETIAIEEVLMTEIGVNGLSMMLSGSRREGFRLKGSDFDVMTWPNDIRVATDVSQSVHYDPFNTVLLLTDSSESPPGFTLLQLMIPTSAADLNRGFPFFVKMHGRFYISSSSPKKLAREIMRLLSYHNLTEHGPCNR